MKLKLLVGILLLIVAAGVAWFVLKPGDLGIPLLSAPYPKELGNLGAEVRIQDQPDGASLIQASQAGDLALAQGLQQGRRAGEQLDLLRRLFRGEKVPELPPDLRELAELFYYLDLEAVAVANERLYPPQLHMLLKRFANGLSEGSAELPPWTVADVLLIQRGYSFLMGRNFIKDWSVHRLASKINPEVLQVASTYPTFDFEAVTHGLQISPRVEALFGLPLLETVRLSAGNTLGCQTRTHPFLSFVFQPCVLRLEGRFEASGIAMMGQPFLWAGSTEALTFYRQPVMMDDEQFYAVPDNALFDDVYVSNEAASQRAAYGDAPMHGPNGRRVAALAGGKPGYAYFYDWDGLRPSADLAASYYLLQSKTIDDALSAYQYHQVPSTELCVRPAKGFLANVLFASSDPNQARQSGGLFSNAYIRMGQRIDPVRSFHGANREPWLPDQLNQVSLSNLDAEMAALVRFYLQGPIGEQLIPLAVQQRILDRLTRDATVERDAFIQHLWQVMFKLFQSEYLGSEAPTAQRALSVECQRLILQLYGRRARSEDETFETQANRIKVFASLLSEAWTAWEARSDEPSKYQLPDKNGKVEEVEVTHFARSPDAGTGLFYLVEGLRIGQVATHLVVWGEEPQFWVYPYAATQKFDVPKLLPTLGGNDGLYYVRPKF